MSGYEAEAQPLAPDFVPPETAEPAAPTATPEEEAWAPSRDEWNQMSEANGYILEQLSQIAQLAQPQQEQDTRLDPLAEDFEDRLSTFLDQRLQPFQHAQQQWQQSEGKERAQDILSDNVSRDGEFIFEGSSQKALTLAETYLPEMQQRYGATPQAAEAAINAAAKDVREYERAVGEAYHKRQMNQLQTLNDAPREPSPVVAPAVQHTGPPPGDEMAVVAKYGGYGH